MWRVVCVGPGPRDRVRRLVDRGPLLTDELRAISIANYLRSTGFYESVKVEVSSASAAVIGTPDMSFQMGEEDAHAREKSVDELSSLIEETGRPDTAPATDET